MTNRGVLQQRSEGTTPAIDVCRVSWILRCTQNDRQKGDGIIEHALGEPMPFRIQTYRNWQGGPRSALQFHTFEREMG